MIKNENGHYVVEFLQPPNSSLEYTKISDGYNRYGLIHTLEGYISVLDFQEICVNYYYVHVPVDWCGLEYKVANARRDVLTLSVYLTIQRKVDTDDVDVPEYPEHLTYLSLLREKDSLEKELAEILAKKEEEKAINNAVFDPIMSLEI